MSIYFNRLVFKLTPIIVGLIILLTTALESMVSASRFPLRTGKRIIIIDPGHGGHDKGARGPSGSLEKTITLLFAQRLQDNLKQQYHVRLTRTADYALDNINRTNISNHAKADLFLSIHTGSGFLHHGDFGRIFYYAPFAAAGKQFPEYRSRKKRNSPTIQNRPWDEMQKPHIPASRQLAEILLNQIRDSNSLSDCKIHSAPLSVLQSLDMPAILIEIGYLSNPTQEKNLKDPDYLDRFVNVIHQSIDIYFKHTKP